MSTIIGGAISLVTALATMWLSSSLTVRRERARELWSQRREQLADLEASAGMIAERLGGYGQGPEEWLAISEELVKLRVGAGRFRRFPDVVQAIRDFHNRAGWVWHNRNQYPEPHEREEAVREMDAALSVLTAACDVALGVRTPARWWRKGPPKVGE